MEYAVAVAVVLSWFSMAGPTEVVMDRTAARAMAITNRGTCRGSAMYMESRGPCRGNPRISAVARGKTHGRPRKCHGHYSGPPPKSQLMCIRAWNVRRVVAIHTTLALVAGSDAALLFFAFLVLPFSSRA